MAFSNTETVRPRGHSETEMGRQGGSGRPPVGKSARERDQGSTEHQPIAGDQFPIKCPKDDASAGIAPLLVHIGFHKTGSTWLQNNLFCDTRFGYQQIADAPRHQIVEHFVLPDPLFFDAEATASLYASYLAATRQAGRTLAISHER